MASNIRTEAYDLTMQLSDDTVLGLMLAPDEDGRPSYATRNVPLLPPRQQEGSAGYEMFDPLIDLPLAQDDWSLGIGHQHILPDHPESRVQVASLTNIDTSIHHQAILAPNVIEMSGITNAAAGGYFFNSAAGNLFYFVGVYVYLYNTSTSTWDLKDTLEGSISGQPAEFDANIFVPLGTGTAYEYSSDEFDTAGTASTLSDTNAVGFAVYHDNNNAPLLVKHNGTQELKTSTNPVNSGSQWGSAVKVGSTAHGINAMVPLGGSAKEDNLIVFKDDGMYSFDESGNVVDESPEFRGQPDTNFGIRFAVWRNKKLYYRSDAGTLMCWDPIDDPSSEPTTIYPPPFASGTSKNIGTVEAVGKNWRGLYIAIKNADSEYRVLFGFPTGFRSELTGAQGIREEVWSWTWGLNLGSDASDAMIVTANNGEANEWLVYRKGSEVAYSILPRPGLNPQTDANCEFAVTGQMICPAMDGNLVEQTKDVTSISVTGHDVGATESVAVSYAVNGSGTPETDTYVTAGLWSSGTKASFTVPASTTAERIATRFEFRRADGTATSTPSVHGYAWHTVLRGSQRWSRQFLALCDDRIMLNNGVRDDTQTGVFIEDTLRQTMNPSKQTGPVRIADNRKPRRIFWAHVHEIEELMVSIGGEATKPRFQRVYRIVAVDATEGLNKPARYNESFKYNAGNEYARAS